MQKKILAFLIVMVSIMTTYSANISYLKILNGDHVPVGGTIKFIGYLDGSFGHTFFSGTDTITYEVELYKENNSNPLKTAKYKIYTQGLPGQINPDDFVITWHSNGSYYQQNNLGQVRATWLIRNFGFFFQENPATPNYGFEFDVSGITSSEDKYYLKIRAVLNDFWNNNYNTPWLESKRFKMNLMPSVELQRYTEDKSFDCNYYIKTVGYGNYVVEDNTPLPMPELRTFYSEYKNEIDRIVWARLIAEVRRINHDDEAVLITDYANNAEKVASIPPTNNISGDAYGRVVIDIPPRYLTEVNGETYFKFINNHWSGLAHYQVDSVSLHIGYYKKNTSNFDDGGWQFEGTGMYHNGNWFSYEQNNGRHVTTNVQEGIHFPSLSEQPIDEIKAVRIDMIVKDVELEEILLYVNDNIVGYAPANKNPGQIETISFSVPQQYLSVLNPQGSNTFRLEGSDSPPTDFYIYSWNISWDYIVDNSLPLEIVARNPYPNQQNIGVRSPVYVTFKSPININTVNTSSFKVHLDDTSTFSGTYDLINDGKEIVFTPASDYPEYTYIDVRLTTEIQDVNGNTLPANEEYSFRTGPSDVTPPTVVSKSPDAGVTGVPLNQNIVVTFSEGMDENSAHSGTILVTGNYRGSYDYNYSWSNNSTVLIIDPVVNFHSEEDITVSLTTGLKDKGGNPLDQNYIWTFTGADLFPPAPPHNIQSVTGNLLVQLTWDPSPTPDAERYRIYRKRSNDPTYQEIFTTSPGAPLVYTDIVPENFTHYYYKISALDEAGNESLLSPYHETYAWKTGTIDISGVINHNTTFTGGGTLYNLTGDLRISDDATLTIEPGSIIEFNSSGIDVGYGSHPTSPGHLVADNITFRSTYNTVDRRLLVHISGSDLSITNCLLDNVYIRSNDGCDFTSLQNCFINTNNSIHVEGNSNANIQYNGFINTSNFGIYYSGTSLIDGTNNFWGHPSGPHHSSNPNGQGCNVSDNVDFTPWSTSAFHPFLDMNLSSINETRDVDEIVQINLVLYNQGSQNLTFQIQENDTANVNIPWLNLSTYSGSINPVDSQVVVVEFNTTGLQFNTTYTTNLVIQNNSMNKPEEIIPVTLNIVHENRAPVFSSTLSISFKEDESFTQRFSDWFQYISDFETPDSLLNWSFIPSVNIAYQQFTDSVTFTAPQNWFGNDTLFAIISDGSLFDSTELFVSVLSVNDPPQILPSIPTIIFPEDSSYTFDLDNHIYDVDHSLNEISWGFGFPSNILSKINSNEGKFGGKYENKVKTSGSDLNFHSNDRVDFQIQDQSHNDNSFQFEINQFNIEYDFTPKLNNLKDSNDLFTNYKIYRGNNDSLIINIDSLTHITTISATSNFYGSNIPIFFIAVDDSNASVRDTTSITILSVNDKPVISSIPSVTIVEDDSIVINYDYLNGYASDPDTPDSLFTYRINSTKLLIDSTYQKFVIYGPPNWFGNDSLQVIVFDQFSLSDTTIWFIDVNPVNDPPVAKADSATTTEDAPKVIPVLANDSDIDNDTLAVTAVTQGMNGSVAINPDSTVTYTPAADYNGPDQFSYVVSDGNSGRDTADVFITVMPANDPPVVAHPIADMSVPEDFAALIVADLDTVFFDIDGDSLDYGAASLGLNVTVQLSGSALVLNSTPNYFGTETVVVNADDQVNRVVAQDTFVVTITPVNDPPVAIADSATTSEDTPVAIAVLANDTDIENDPLSVAAITQGINGSVAINPDSTVTYTPNTNYYGADQFSYVVSDGNAGLDTSDVFVTVNPANDPPVLSTLPPVNKLEDEWLYLLVANWYPLVTDPDNADSTLLWSFELEDLVSIQQNSDSLVFQPVPDAFGLDSVRVIVSDGQLADSTELLVQVQPVNDPPVITLHDTLVCQEDDSLSLWLDTCAVDIDDPLYILSWQIAILPPAMNPADSITINYDSLTHVVTFIPNTNYTVLNARVIIVVSDTSEAADSVSLVFNIVPVNDPPVIAPLPALSFAEDDSLLVLNNFWHPFVNDPDTPDSLLFYQLLGGQQVSATAQSGGSLLHSPRNWFGNDSLKLLVGDGEYQDSAWINVTVTPVNDPPVIADSLPDFFEFVNGDSVGINLWEFVEDPETPDSLLNFTLNSDTSGLIIHYQFASGWLKLQAAPHFSGEGKLFIAVSDDSGATDLDTTTVMVNPNSLDAWQFEIPRQFVLEQNYPNPFNPVTHIRFGVPKRSQVKIELYNLLGQQVAVLLDRLMEPGYYEVDLQAGNLASGIYIYRMRAEKFQQLKKLLLIK